MTVRLSQYTWETQSLTDQAFQTHGVLPRLLPTTTSASHSMLMPATGQCKGSL